MMGISLPFRERPFRTVAALAIAPCVNILALLILKYIDYDEGHIDSSFLPSTFPVVVSLCYIASAIFGAMASILRILLKIPLKAGVFVALFALSAGVWGLFNGTLPERLLMTGLLIAYSLPVSISYCAIAGIRWR